ncbi:uncharacterized protein EDB91DRAFT_1100207 [Suillus paluster]|uniref:uncharacterized protein n=1 Tax=Suillus paluster TaxID=48578 RepID=UPI001B87F0BE|nr:uncharacterized protein EDB91DRAFT_1100207 [Suillus paluster]KAG1753851.1 hypothetical protein EDB91DRAFT_1100207 [Suillus paluster]
MASPSNPTSKRSSPNSPIKGRVKRHKSERADSEGCVPYARPLPLTATHGVEEIKLAPGTRASDFTQEEFNKVISERQHLLFTQGRRVVGVPLVFEDGIVIHWIYDPIIKDSGETKPRLTSELSRPEVRTVASAPADPAVDNEGKRSFSPRVRGMGATLVSDADLSQTAGPSDDCDSDIEIISFRLAGSNGVTKDEHQEASSPFARLDNKVPLYSGTAGQDDDEHFSSKDMDSFSRSRAVSTMRRDHAMAELCGEWGPIMRSSSMAPSSDDDRPNELADVNDATEASSSRTKVRTSPARTLGALRGQRPPNQGYQRRPIASSSKSTTAARRGVSSQPGRPTYHSTSGHATSTDDSDGSGVPLRSRRLRQVISLSSESSSSDSEQDIVGLPTLTIKRVALPKTPHGRPRRLLVPASDNLPLAAITMRADVQFINRRDQFRLSLNSLPNPGVYRHVEDACVVGDTVVLGYNSGPSQVTFLPVTTEAPCKVDAQALPHVTSPQVPRSSGEGVRCLAAMSASTGSLQFFTGGHDRRVFSWTADTQALQEATVTKLNVFLDSGVSAMAYCHNNNSLISSDTKKLYVTDLTREYTPKPAPVSNDVYQIHVHPQTPDLTLLEVRHLDHQILMFDRRMGDFNRTPCCTFGHRSADAKFEPSYTKGSVSQTFFVRGHQDGTVLLWDFRNVKNILRRSQLTEAVVHSVISGGDVVTFGGGVVTFLNKFLHS